MVNHDQMETVHLYVMPEDQLPPPPDYVGISIATLCSLFLVGIIGLIIFSPKELPTVSFTTTISGFQLPVVSKSIRLTIQATGQGHTNATYAHGAITFYNGQTYTQIIPVGTTLKGANGVTVITDAQAIIPPAAQTTPPTYGQVSVPAHALQPGAAGNISAGDINQPCCVTSVIAQNPYSFSGGVNARDFTYLTEQDVTHTVAFLSPTLQQGAKALFRSSIVLDPICLTTSASSPAIGQEAKTAVIAVKTLCTALSYSPTLAKQQIVASCHCGALTNMQFSVVRMSNRKGVISLNLYVTAVVKPMVHTRFANTGK